MTSRPEARLKGRSDVLMVETIFDTRNAKAALFAIDEYFEYFEHSGERLPLIISGTVTDASGHILSSQTVTALWHSVHRADAIARSVALVGGRQVQRGVFLSPERPQGWLNRRSLLW